MRSLVALAVLGLSLTPALAAASGDEGEHAGRNASHSVSDPAGDEASTLALPGGLSASPLACHDPSIDILSVTAAVRQRTLRVEVRHAAPVQAPRLTCSGVPVGVAGQSYGLGIGAAGDSFLFLSVRAAEACLYVLFENPVQISDCVPAGRVDGASIRLEVGLRGSVPVGEGGMRPYWLNGTLSIHAFNQEQGAPRPGPGTSLAPSALLRVEDQSADLSLKVGR
jgi:hypothetical protein